MVRIHLGSDGETNVERAHKVRTGGLRRARVFHEHRAQRKVSGCEEKHHLGY